MAAAAQRMATRLTGTAQRLFEQSKPYGRVMWKYARVEMKPPTMPEVTQAQERLLQMSKSARSGAWKNITVKEAGINTVIALEIACWFFVGECIGKRSLLGYQIPGILNNHVELVCTIDGGFE